MLYVSSRTTISMPPTTSETRLYMTETSVVRPVISTLHTTPRKITTRNHRSVSAKIDPPSSTSVSFTAISSTPCGIPTFRATDQRITIPSTNASAIMKYKTKDTLRTVQGSILRTMRRTRLTDGMKGWVPFDRVYRIARNR